MSTTKHSSIPVQVLLHIAWRNIVTKKLRSALTILGVVIGVGAIFFLLSLGLGIQNLVTNEIIGSSSVKSIDITSPNSKIVKLNQETSDKIKNLGNVDSLGNSYSFAGSLKFNNSDNDVIVYGLDSNYQELSKLVVPEGRLLKSDDTDSILVNKSALQSIGIKDPKQAIGKQVDLLIPLKTTVSETSGNKDAIQGTFKVVGIVDSGAGGEVFVQSSLFDQAGVEQYSQIKLIVKDTNDIPSLRKQIESMGLETVSLIDTIDQINQIFKYFNLVLVSLGAIGMIVSILGMFNTLTISLLERTKEIGLMLALGGRKRDMRRLFIIEAVLLSLVGSITGIILSIIVGVAINFAMNHLATGRGVGESFDLFATPMWLVLGLTLFMVLVGLIVVFIPSRRAENINPIDALRRE